MKFAYKFRLQSAERILRKKSLKVSRKKESCNLTEAREIGLIFNATDSAQLEEIKKFVGILQEKHSNVFVIGFVNDKKIDEIYLLRSGFNFFSVKDLTWFFKPVSPFVEDFLNRKFDILFDLDLDNSYPLRYIATLSKAGMKVGKFFEKCDYLDVMIKIESNNSINFLIEQCIHYVNMLRKPEEVQ